MFSYTPNFYQERLQRLVVRGIPYVTRSYSLAHAVIRHLQGSKLTRDIMVMKAVTAWCCRVRFAAPEIQFPTEQRGSILYSFLLYPLHKIFSHLQNKKVRIFFFFFFFFFFLYIKIDFWHGRSGTVMAFIPDNISAHVHLLEDNDPIKKQRWLLSAGFFSLADQKKTRVFRRRSLQVYLCRFCRQRKVKTFSSCGAHFRSGDNIFSVQIVTTTVCMQWPTRVFVNHSKDAFV